MHALKVPLNVAEKVRRELIQKNNLNTDYSLIKDDDYLYLPLNKKINSTYELVDKSFKKIIKNPEFKESLKEKLTLNEFESLKTAFDQIGDIAIIEIDDELINKEKIIAKSLLESSKTIKTVLKKGGVHEGEFRTQKMVYLAGENKKITIHKENNVKLKIDVEKVYYSPRLSHERKRIVGLVKDGEEILVMFSGGGVYPLVISKNTKAKSIIGIEKNPIGHKYALENQILNKRKNILFIEGDVRKEVPKLKEKFDRILMPLPRSAEKFLDLAFLVAKKETIIHLYQFVSEEDFEKTKKEVIDICKKNKVRCTILNLVKCGQFSPKIFRICIDFKINNI